MARPPAPCSTPSPLTSSRASAPGIRRRLALIFGPILFDHSDEQAARRIDDAFDIALARDVAVGFHLDDSMFWHGGRDLVEDPRNVERADWDSPPSARRLDWGRFPRLAPQTCLNSPAIEAEVRRRGIREMSVRPICTDEEHRAALREIEALWGPTEGSAKGDELDVLLALLADALFAEFLALFQVGHEHLARSWRERRGPIAEPFTDHPGR
jgi:hypothetical protein